MIKKVKKLPLKEHLARAYRLSIEKTYCPNCGNRTFSFDADKQLCLCTHCGLAGPREDILRELIDEFEYQNQEDLSFDLFQYVKLSIGHLDLHDKQYYIEEIKVDSDGAVEYKDLIRPAFVNTKKIIKERIRTGYLKNIKPLKEWVAKVLKIVSKCKYDEVQPCDAGGTIEVLKFRNFTIKNLSMWTASEDMCIFNLGDSFLNDNFEVESTEEK